VARRFIHTLARGGFHQGVPVVQRGSIRTVPAPSRHTQRSPAPQARNVAAGQRDKRAAVAGHVDRTPLVVQPPRTGAGTRLTWPGARGDTHPSQVRDRRSGRLTVDELAVSHRTQRPGPKGAGPGGEKKKGLGSRDQLCRAPLRAGPGSRQTRFCRDPESCWPANSGVLNGPPGVRVRKAGTVIPRQGRGRSRSPPPPCYHTQLEAHSAPAPRRDCVLGRFAVNVFGRRKTSTIVHSVRLGRPGSIGGSSRQQFGDSRVDRVHEQQRRCGAGNCHRHGSGRIGFGADPNTATQLWRACVTTRSLGRPGVCHRVGVRSLLTLSPLPGYLPLGARAVIRATIA